MGTFSFPEENGSKKMSLRVREKKELKVGEKEPKVGENRKEEMINESPFCFKCFFPLIIPEIIIRLTYN